MPASMRTISAASSSRSTVHHQAANGVGSTRETMHGLLGSVRASSEHPTMVAQPLRKNFDFELRGQKGGINPRMPAQRPAGPGPIRGIYPRAPRNYGTDRMR